MDLSQVVARAHVPQQEAAHLRSGNRRRSPCRERRQVQGKVTLVSPRLTHSTTVEVWVQGRIRKED